MTVSRPRRWHGRVLLFDLFGTVVHFAPLVPRSEDGGPRWQAAMFWLRDVLSAELPGIAIEDFLRALASVSDELVRQRPPEHREVPSCERFRRAVMRLDVDPERAALIAPRLSLAHMTHLAARTLLPDGHRALLRALATRYRLGLISNFDHAPTARRILADHDIADCFTAVLISDEFGRRKPHPAIFERALDALEATARQALFIGDSVSDDVVGGHNAGLPVVWVNSTGESLPPEVPPPAYVIRQLGELTTLLA